MSETASDPLELLNEALALTEAVREVARTGDFEQVGRLLAERHGMLEAVFERESDAGQADAIRNGVARLEVADKELLALLDEARSALRENCRSLDLERRAQVAYGRV